MICIFGGSGFYDFLENMKTEKIETPFGSVTYEIGTIGNKEVVFIPRHGKQHSIPPSQINYRANIFAAHKLKSNAILATNAVGSIRENIPPGTFVTPDNIIDFTSGRADTFFDGGNLSVTTRLGNLLEGVVHVDVSEVFNPNLRYLIRKASSDSGTEIQEGGTIVATNGPRFESPAEIKAYRILGADFAGMTSSPEVFLAKELEIPYATLAVITNYGAGLQNSVSAEEVFELFKSRITEVKEIFTRTIFSMKEL